jgi:hypothetical protein
MLPTPITCVPFLPASPLVLPLLSGYNPVLTFTFLQVAGELITRVLAYPKLTVILSEAHSGPFEEGGGLRPRTPLCDVRPLH